jgi:hypothetical protein
MRERPVAIQRRFVDRCCEVLFGALRPISAGFAANTLFLLQLEQPILRVHGIVARLIRSYVVDSSMSVTQLLVELQPGSYDPSASVRGTPMVIDLPGGASALEIVYVDTESGLYCKVVL